MDYIKFSDLEVGMEVDFSPEAKQQLINSLGGLDLIWKINSIKSNVCRCELISNPVSKFALMITINTETNLFYCISLYSAAVGYFTVKKYSGGFIKTDSNVQKNNDGREECYWCSGKTKQISTGFSYYNICSVCGK